MPTEIEAEITNVTVFRDGARVTRSGEYHLAAGEQIVLVKGISQYAHSDSFRVKGRGAAVLKGIDVKSRTEVFEPEGDLASMREELDGLERGRKRITDDIEQQQTRLVHLTSIAEQFSTEFGQWYAAGESSIENLDKMDKTMVKMLNDVRKKLRELNEKLEEVVIKIQVIHANIDRIQGQRRTIATKEVQVTLDVKEDSDVELEVTYQLGRAGWSPTYDLDIGDGTSDLKRIALVHNQTIEDWKDVRLIVSTASARRVEAVKASPFYLDTLSPTVGYGGRLGVVAKGAPEAAEYYDEDEGLDILKEEEQIAYEPEPEIEETYATASETLSGTIIYEVPGKVSIPSGDEPQPITLTEESFDSRRLYYWNAYAMPEVVAQDEITNADSVMLPGTVKVYAAGDFLGETNVGLIAPRETFRLGTRTAYDVKAEKKLAGKDTEKAGLSRGKRRRGYEYRLEIESFSKKPIEMRVIDRIPHSNSEKIQVELKPMRIPMKKSELGVLEWEVTVEAEKELTIEYAFEVEWEKDVQIQPPLP
ncbi:MAG: mucoidy inhibitor MuiA family protein [Candidatus Hermodarchaeota archaeon]